MVTIEMDLDRGSVWMEGHSRHAAMGQDIVCAAVSAVSQVILLAAVNVKGGAMTADVDDGKCVVKAQDGLFKWTLKICAEVFKEIAEEYPDEVRLRLVERME